MDYDETTDPAYRGDAEITARVEEDAATRDELERDQAAEGLYPEEWGAPPCQPIGCDNGFHIPGCVYAEIDQAAELAAEAAEARDLADAGDRVTARERLEHGNSGPGGPLPGFIPAEEWPAVSAVYLTEHYNQSEFVTAARDAQLRILLAEIAEHDTDYDVRYGLVLTAVSVAARLGYAAGFRIDPNEPDWPVAYIELPTGQVSWHMPAHPHEWDGHTTDQKYDRIRQFTGHVYPCDQDGCDLCPRIRKQ